MLSWGNANDGQLGLGGIEETSINVPRWNKHIGHQDVRHVGCGLKHTVIVLKNGRVFSCGSNEKGQLGQDQTSTRPGLISGLETFAIRRVACGNYHSLALDDKGQVYSWGDGQYGQLGLGMANKEVKFFPRLVKTLKDRVTIQVACGGNHCLVITKDGCVFSWGLNNHHQLGLESEESSVDTPTLISALSALPVIQVSAGRAHTVVVTRGGVAFSWGRNNFGQLGIGTTKESRTPQQLSILEEEFIRHVACGEEHTALLTENGRLFTCGSSSYGQLGHGSTTNCDIPTLVQGLVGKEVCQVVCGRMHTVAVVSPEGEVYSCGVNSNGQLGSGQRKNLLVPTLISLGHHPAPPLDMGSSENEEREYKLRQVFTGGDQSFATFYLHVTSGNNGAVPSSTSPKSSVSSRTTQEQELTNERTLVDVRLFIHVEMPYFLNDYMMTEVTQLDSSSYNIDMEEAIRVLEIVFSSSACMNGSLILKSRRCTTQRPGVDVIEALRIFQMLRERLRPETIESQTRFIMHLISQQPMEDHACDCNLELELTNKLLPNLNLKPCGLEGLRIFYILPAYMMKPARKDLIKVYMERFLELDKKRMTIILDWLYNGPVDYVVLMIVSLRKLLFRYTFRLKDDPKKVTIGDVKGDQDMMRVSLRFLRILYQMNFKCNEPIPYDQWHYPQLTEIIDLQEDFFDWMDNKSGEVIVLCEYPFVLDARAKSVLMQVECLLKMRMAVTKAYTQNFQSLFTDQTIADSSPDCFVLTIDRENIVENTVIQLLQSGEENFRKPLKIQFIGEEGEDGGGVAKEFFMLLSQRILNPDFGMFVEDEESHLMWFRDGETLFYEKTDYYIIIGILCGLAIYNSITVYLPFPITLYKKLLDRPPSFDDFKEMFPVMGRSLQYLLDYSGDDFEETFNLNFTITRQVFGEVKVIELKEKGSEISVTKSNRNDFIYLYMKYFIIDSIREQFKAFKNGFLRVCSGKVLSLLHPRELMSLVVGTQVKSWEEMRLFTGYRNGYSKEDQTIVMFWDVFNSFSEETKGKFLVFLTGTNRIPIKGFEKMGIIIQKMDGGEGFEKLPVAHTCFNVLDLPPYPTKEKMRDKLLQAMNFTTGFGII